MSEISKDFMIYLLQISTLYNASVLGWKIRKISPKIYELSKDKSQITEMDKDTARFLHRIISFDFNNSIDCVK